MHEVCTPIAHISVKSIGCVSTTPHSCFVAGTYRWDFSRLYEKMKGRTEGMEEVVS